MRTIAYDLLMLYWLILLARVVLSFFPTPPSGPIRGVTTFVYAVTEPVLRPLRAMIPPIRAGAVGFDLSPMIVFIVIFILAQAIHP